MSWTKNRRMRKRKRKMVDSTIPPNPDGVGEAVNPDMVCSRLLPAPRLVEIATYLDRLDIVAGKAVDGYIVGYEGTSLYAIGYKSAVVKLRHLCPADWGNLLLPILIYRLEPPGLGPFMRPRMYIPIQGYFQLHHDPGVDPLANYNGVMEERLGNVFSATQHYGQDRMYTLLQPCHQTEEIVARAIHKRMEQAEHNYRSVYAMLPASVLKPVPINMHFAAGPAAYEWDRDWSTDLGY